MQLSPENPKKKEAAQERLLQRTLRRSPRKALGNVSNLLAADDSGAVFEASLHQPLETSRTTRLRSGGGSSSIISQQVQPQILFIRPITYFSLVRSEGFKYPSHLSKQSSDLKQNGTQEKTPFSGTVFNTLSHGVIRFVASVSSKNHLLTG